MKIRKSHDKIFKRVFSDKEYAAHFLKNSLPEKLSAKIDFNTLQLDNNSYIRENLRERFADMVFNVRYDNKDDIKITLLLEHKSSYPDYPHLQVLEYILGIWNSDATHKRPLTPVVPVVLYAGEDKWNPKPFEEYFSGMDNNLRPFQPLFEYRLIDLTTKSEEEIDRTYQMFEIKLTLQLMKKIAEQHNNFTNFAMVFTPLEGMKLTDKRESFLVSILMYLISNIDEEPEKIIKEISQLSQTAKNIAMTTAEKLIEQGKRKGLLEGIKTSIIKMYSKGHFDIKTIADLLEVSVDFVKQTLKEAKLR